MLVKKSFSLSGHRTSVALEPEFWHVLERLGAEDGCPLGAFVARIDATRTQAEPLASRLRVVALVSTLTFRKGHPGIIGTGEETPEPTGEML